MARDYIKCNFTLYRWEPSLKYCQIVVLQIGENMFGLREMGGNAIQIAPFIPNADADHYDDLGEAIMEAERLRDKHLANGWQLHPEEIDE